MKKLGLPIGVENFGKIRNGKAYYVDKTLFIKDIIDSQNIVILCTRPRRFGKTLALSMLQHYFENSMISKAHIFDGLKIADAGDEYAIEQNRYPVIALSLKRIEGKDFDTAFEGVKSVVAREYERHDYLLKSDSLTDGHKLTFQKLIDREGNKTQYDESLQFLSECLERHFNEKVIILIDEYDVPLEKAYFRRKNYYDDMVEFIRLFFGNALKTNNSLHKAILTGCLRVSKESIFTGVNNFDVISILSREYDEYFGFTEEEVKEALVYYEISHKATEARDWYNGYLIGNTTVYNPWSMIKYLRDASKSEDHLPISYWGNTASNSIIKELIYEADETTKQEIEALMRGETLLKPIFEDIIYAEIKQNMNYLWSFLLFTGYLKQVGVIQKGRKNHYELKIPNDEIAYIYERFIWEWTHEHIHVLDYNPLYQGLLNEDVEVIADVISDALFKSISYLDSAENFYHGFMTGILGLMPSYQVKSNRESGHGRNDVFLIPNSIRKPAIVIEFKVAKEAKTIRQLLNESINQIEEKQYAAELEDMGFSEVMKYGLVFFRKDCFAIKG